MRTSATQLTLSTRVDSVGTREEVQLELSAQFLERYQVGPVLGCGAMGMVCRGVQLSVRRPVAIKFLKVAKPEHLARFLREGRVLARISHPAVMRVFDTNETGGHPYLITELLEGGTLTERLKAGPLPWRSALELAVPLLEGLAACHAAGVVHRDIKPDNILFGVDGLPRIADLGIARDDHDTESLTRTGALVGTPRYMAPEQLAQGRAGPASDLWSMAAVVHEMIAGQPPYAGGSMFELIEAHRQPVRRLDEVARGVPRAVAEALQRALETDEALRPASASELAEQLRSAATAREARARRSGPTSRPVGVPVRDRLTGRSPVVDFARSHPRSAAAAAGLSAALAAGTLAWLALWPAQPVRPECRLVERPTILAGATGAFVRWKTSTEAPTQLIVWGGGREVRDFAILKPPAGAPGSGTSHELAVRGLRGPASCAPVLPGGLHGPERYSIALRADLRGAVRDVAVRFADVAHLEVNLQLDEVLTAGVSLETEGGGAGQPVWAPIRGPRALTLVVPAPPAAGDHRLQLVFRELEDRIPLGRARSLDDLRRTVENLWTPPQPLELARDTVEILGLAPRYYRGLRSGLPTAQMVRELEEAPRRRLLAEARGIAKRCLARRGVDLTMFSSALPLWRGDAQMPIADRRRLHASLQRLTDLDAASELVAGAPAIGMEQALGLRVPASPRTLVPAGGYHPLEHLADPRLRAQHRERALVLPSSINASAEALLATFGEDVYDTARLALPDAEDPQHRRGLWVGLPDLPSGLADGPVRIVLQVASIAPDDCVWLRIGTATLIAFRSSLAAFQGNHSLRAQRAEVLTTAQTMIVDLPAGYIEPGATKLALRLEYLSTRPELGERPMMSVSVCDLAIMRRE